MNAQICGKKNDSNYDGNCAARHCLSGTYEISRRWIFVRLSVLQPGGACEVYSFTIVVRSMSYKRMLPKIMLKKCAMSLELCTRTIYRVAGKFQMTISVLHENKILKIVNFIWNIPDCVSVTKI